jgi:hypothetical protein
VALTVDWYRAQSAGADLGALTRRQIAEYAAAAADAGIAWALDRAASVPPGSA